MPSDPNYGPLCDILRNIELARSFVSDHTYDSFRTDRRTVYAVILCLEIVSEASRRLTNDLKARHPHLPWSDIAGAGNIYRHDYEEVIDQIVWDTVQRDLEPVNEAARAELRKLKQ
jgi:uncharacterized protein with HEPN domain